MLLFDFDHSLKEATGNYKCPEHKQNMCYRRWPLPYEDNRSSQRVSLSKGNAWLLQDSHDVNECRSTRVFDLETLRERVS